MAGNLQQNIFALCIGAIISVLYFTAWQRIADKLMETRTARKAYLQYLAASTAFQLAVNILMMIPALFPIAQAYGTYILTASYYLQAALLWFMLYRHAHRPRAFSSVALAFFFIYNTAVTFTAVINVAIRDIFAQAELSYSALFIIAHLATLLEHILILAASLLIGQLMRKTRFAVYYAALFSKPRRAWLTCIISIVIMQIYDIISYLYPDVQYSYTFYYTAILVDIAALFLILFVAAFESNREKVKAQEAFIVQQQIYVQTLEGLQQDLRAFRHDYQNLLSGLYLQAAQGDTDALRETLQGTLHYFDERLGSQIHRVTELARVTIPEVKSLLLVKLIQAEEAHVPIRLEIPFEVNRIDMNMGDFLRCFGILVDNALEAAANMPGQPVHVALLQEAVTFTLLVTNPCAKKPDLPKLAGQGYTTKGSGRGTGLASYAAITGRYNNTMCSTGYEDGRFRQELKIWRLA